MHSVKVFTTIGLKNGIFHVEVEEDSRKHTSFITHNGQCKFLKCLYGLTDSPSAFQKYIYNMFCKLLKANTVIVIYIDVLRILSRAEDIEKLKLVLLNRVRVWTKVKHGKAQFFET